VQPTHGLGEGEGSGAVVVPGFKEAGGGSDSSTSAGGNGASSGETLGMAASSEELLLLAADGIFGAGFFAVAAVRAADWNAASPSFARSWLTRCFA
jgi:hypothetical protein